ncbi:MAG: hypothetical protein HQ581_00705 [Planctomycetes bacterium]|nr:hypothetical protein [Planctomycetota bacterium]
MFYRSLSFVCLAALAVGSTVAAQDMLGPIDVQSLRARTLGEVLPGAMAESMMAEPDMTAMPCDNAQSWGVVLGEIPELLYIHCPALQDGRGLLITHVCQYSPAEEAGLVSGQILLQVGEQVLYKPADLPVLCRPAKVALLDEGKVVEATLAPVAIDAAVPDREMRGFSAERFRMPATRGLSTTSATSSSDSQQAIAIGLTNGRYKIEAMDVDGKVKLQGTRTEINRQLKSVPKPLRQAIQSRLPRTTDAY